MSEEYKILTDEEVYDAAAAQLCGNDELELDDKEHYVPVDKPPAGRFSRADDGCWVQVWMWIPFPSCECGWSPDDEQGHEQDCPMYEQELDNNLGA